MHGTKTKQRRGQDSCPDAYHGNLETLVITGGNYVQNNRHHITHHHDNSQTFNTRNEKTVFNDRVCGFIREVKNAKGPIAAYKHETNVPYQDEGLDPVPRSLLRASKQGAPSHIPAINHDIQPQCDPPQSTHHMIANRVSVSQAREVAGGRTVELGRLTLTGGDSSSRRAPPPLDVEVEAELSQLSPEMQEFVASLQYKATQTVTVEKGRKKQRRSQMSAARKPVSAQRQRVDPPQMHNKDSRSSGFNDGSFTVNQQNGLRR